MGTMESRWRERDPAHHPLEIAMISGMHQIKTHFPGIYF
jgi:hypothetical protein